MHCLPEQVSEFERVETLIGESTEVGTALVTVCAADANTVAVHVTATFPVGATVANQIRIGHLIGARFFALAALTLGKPSVVLRRADLGDALAQPLFAIASVVDHMVDTTRARLRPRRNL